ncbi:OPT oligopeptide transporter protein-domain-containing protein [Xylaria bambusicola]|uniref:OPT oligopeptide transporter protein-domain-containing protein n=1 Tax=Xylaria bambusicola TaxID=326684 RepID=UPI00200776AE|nr:OPT oligopeptide transporter protein-domain-containing protein [Xylaria bambusicola]KAI0505383.1 OPT oligopeptide transporter protein-domain-containing protein [Xylaria bambusicola]
MSLETPSQIRREVEHPLGVDDDFNITVTSDPDDRMGSVPPRYNINPFVPFENAPTTPIINIVTPRAVLIGSLCGALVNASNIYLGLKAGWTTSANILGAIVGFSALKKWTAGTNHPFGPHENNIVQTVATASGGMSNVFISAVPALYQLGLLKSPTEDFFRVVALTAVGGYFGLLSIVPLRKFFIEHVASELNLVFPSSMATAITIRSMHSAANGEQVATLKMRTTIYAFIAAMTLRVTSQWMPGVFWNWHIFTWLAELGIAPSLCVAAESWGWSLEWSPAMLGSGMLVEFGVACSFFGGSVLAWGIIGPYLVAQGIATGEYISSKPGWTGFMSYAVMSSEFANAAHPSPRYWLLWPGVACTLTVAFVELACQWRILWKFAVLSTMVTISTIRPIFQGRLFSGYNLVESKEETGAESSPQENRGDIARWMWAPGVVVLVVLAGVVAPLLFEMSALETLLALFLSLCLSLVAIQATGATDTTPLNAISKVSQLILSGATQAAGGSITDAQRLNLLGASLTNIGASQGVDLIGDFRVGFLLGTPPRLQYVAQLLGTFVATMVAPSIFVLFTKAYPCIIAKSEDQMTDHTCQFPGPAVASWRAVAIAVSESTSPIPASSATFSIAFAASAGLLAFLKQVLFTGRLSFLRNYQPNMMILALAFTLPTPQTGITMMVGAIMAKVWKRKRPSDFEQLGFGVAAGLVAGEGIGGTINCILSILGISGEQWASNIGCPASIC